MHDECVTDDDCPDDTEPSCRILRAVNIESGPDFGDGDGGGGDFGVLPAATGDGGGGDFGDGGGGDFGGDFGGVVVVRVAMKSLLALWMAVVRCRIARTARGLRVLGLIDECIPTCGFGTAQTFICEDGFCSRPSMEKMTLEIVTPALVKTVVARVAPSAVPWAVARLKVVPLPVVQCWRWWGANFRQYGGLWRADLWTSATVSVRPECATDDDCTDSSEPTCQDTPGGVRVCSPGGGDAGGDIGDGGGATGGDGTIGGGIGGGRRRWHGVRRQVMRSVAIRRRFRRDGGGDDMDSRRSFATPVRIVTSTIARLVRRLWV